MGFITQAKDEPEKSTYHIGFPRGLNTIQDKSLINDKNLSTAQNVILDVDGISRRPGTTKVYDQGSASYVWGSGAFHKVTTGVRKFVRIANSRLQYLDGSVWTQVDATVFSSAKAEFVQARDSLYIYNGTDNLRNFDGSTISTYTAILTPANLGVTPTGGTGSTRYAYRVTSFNETGESAGSSSVVITNGYATLDTTHYNALAWDVATGADGYNVYGRIDSGAEEVYLATVYTNAYNDDGTDDEVVTKPCPTANTTGGIIAKGGIYTLSRQFVYGVTEGSTYYPTRLYYSGTLDFIDSFVGGEYGGGWVEVYSNDGGEIVDVEPFQDGVLVFKTNGIFKFYFTSAGLPALKEVTRSHGGVSGRGAQQSDNDLLYVAQKENRLAVMTVGQQQNYVGDQLRTNEASIFYSNQLTNVNWAYKGNVATWMFNNTFGFTYTSVGTTENSKGYVFDVRFGGWVFWNETPMECSKYTIYDDGTEVKLYGDSNTDGYEVEMFTEERNDNGEAFTSIVGTKFYNDGMFDVDKVWRNPTLWFKYITGGNAIDVEAWVDGNNSIGSAEIATSSSGAGAGSDLAGGFLAGSMTSTFTAVEEQSDVPVELSLLKIARSMGFYIIDSNLNTNWLFMGIHLQLTPLIGKPSSGVQKVNLS